MTMQEYFDRYWRYYQMLEDEFFSTLNYVKLIAGNFPTISLKYVNILLSIGAELDNFFKVCCNFTGRKTIADYISPILYKYPSITSQTVHIKTYNIVLSPYLGWNTAASSQSLTFWKKYNSVKHDRVSNYSMASLETVINALAGLFILEMYMAKDIYSGDVTAFQSFPEDASKLFVLKNWDLHLKTSNLKFDYTIHDDDDGSIILNKV